MTAEEFFEWARACTRDLRAIDERLARGAEPRAASAVVVGGGVAKDPMAPVDAAIDRESALLADRAYCERVRGRAQEVAYEVGMALGLNAKLALQLYYLELNTWEEIAYELHVSIATVYRLRRQAFEVVDLRGLVVDAGRDGVRGRGAS